MWKANKGFSHSATTGLILQPTFTLGIRMLSVSVKQLNAGVNCHRALPSAHMCRISVMQRVDH